MAASHSAGVGDRVALSPQNSVAFGNDAACTMRTNPLAAPDPLIWAMPT